MRKTILQTSEIAIEKLNKTAVLMHRQMKSGNLDQETADKHISRAQRAVETFRRAYFRKTSDRDHLRQLIEADNLNAPGDVKTANDRFGRVLKHYAKAVGAEFIDVSEKGVTDEN